MLAVVLLVACGGGSKPAPKAPPPPPPKAEPEKAAEPEPPPPPKPLHAKAALAPLKGQKAGGATVSFAQDKEGDETTVTSDDFEGLKPGKYHLVIHDGESCDKPGDPWKGGAAIELAVTITKDQHAMEEAKVKLDLGGVAPAVGHALVLHDDKKGKPNKSVACGAIEAIGD